MFKLNLLVLNQIQVLKINPRIKKLILIKFIKIFIFKRPPLDILSAFDHVLIFIQPFSASKRDCHLCNRALD